MSDMVSVPAEKIPALREALDKCLVASDSLYVNRALLAARAVVDAVETECDHCGVTSSVPFGCGKCCETVAPSPARDDAEKAIAGLLAEHDEARPRRYGAGCQCRCGAPICTEDGGMSHDWHFRAHVASVIAAHMAAPDELTALREEVDQYVFESIPLIAQQRDTAEAELTALREGLRDVLDNWWGNNPRIRIVALLGDE